MYAVRRKNLLVYEYFNYYCFLGSFRQTLYLRFKNNKFSIYKNGNFSVGLLSDGIWKLRFSFREI